MGDLLALADRVERFTPNGPYDIARQAEQDLNEAIARAAGVPCTVEVGHEALGNYRKVPARLPAYTASLDAAASLTPKGAMRRSGDSAVGLMGTFFCDIVLEDGRDFHANANSEACAIVAASLRARLTPPAQVVGREGVRHV